MAKIHITTDQGDLIETIDLKNWDLSKTVSRIALTDEVITAAQAAQRIEEAE